MTVTISVVVIAFCIVVGAQMINKYSTLKSLQAQEQKLKNCRKPSDGLFIMAQAMLTGAGLSARM